MKQKSANTSAAVETVCCITATMSESGQLPAVDAVKSGAVWRAASVGSGGIFAECELLLDIFLLASQVAQALQLAAVAVTT